MSRGMEHKKQHWIPQSYPAPWCDPDTPTEQEPFVWRFNKDGSSPTRRAPKNIFHERDMYTLHLADGTRNLAIERGLSGLEGQFCGLCTRKIESKMRLSADDRLVICAFVAAMHVQTHLLREHLRCQWQQILTRLNHLREAYQEMAPEQQAAMSEALSPLNAEAAPSLSYENVAELALSPVKRELVRMVQQETALLMPMGFSILVTADDPGLITSDAPCVWFDPEAAQRPFPYNLPGLASPKIEITLPISTANVVILGWRRMPGCIELVLPEVVDEINRRTRFCCENHFIVRQNTTRQIWFDSGHSHNGCDEDGST